MKLAKTARSQQIDSLRAFSVMCVIFSHTITLEYKIGEFVFDELGAIGVYMFFVISGFLITSQLLEMKSVRDSSGDSIIVPIRSFMAKRVLRLLPVYYLALLAAWLIDLRTIRVEMPWHMAQMTNILFGFDQDAEFSSPVGHLWSLSMEWQFYLVWPFVVLLSGPRVLLNIICAMIVFSFFSWLEILPLPKEILLSAIPASLDSLGFGALLAIAVDRRWPLGWLANRAWWVGAAALAMTILLMTEYAWLGWTLYPITHEVLNLFFMLIIYRSLTGWSGLTGAVLNIPALQYMGLISYGIYLYHQYIISVYQGVSLRLIGYLPIGLGWRLTVPVLIISLIVAHFSWVWFEEPINRMRQRYSYPARDRSQQSVSSEATSV